MELFSLSAVFTFIISIIGAAISIIVSIFVIRYYIVLPGRLHEIERSIDTLNETMNEIKIVLIDKNAQGPESKQNYQSEQVQNQQPVYYDEPYRN